MKNVLECSAQKLARWVEDHDYKSYEPFDGLLSFLRTLTFGNWLLERLLQQLVRQSPINLRPLLGIKPQSSTKGMAYMAWGYLKMLKATGDSEYKNKTIRCLDWLKENSSPDYPSCCWGNHFPFSGRGVRLAPYQPIIVWTSLIGQVFLDAYEAFQEEEYLEIARSICEWILDLPREVTHTGICLSYVDHIQVSIHNSNMLGAAMLARTAKLTRDNTMLEIANEAMQYSCSRQLPNGAWYYGEGPNMHWIDNFHTGYNLDSLKCYIDCSNDRTYKCNLRRGLEYYKKAFFEEDGRPKYYNNRTYPLDIQCASQAIDTLAHFSDCDQTALELAKKVARWTIEKMQDKDGYFYYRRYPLIKVKTPMLHWGQATTYKALTHLLYRIREK